MLYEPTNLIPSNLTQTGTVAAGTDDVNIQWQVNGNSAMTMFQIDVMQDNADSTLVYSTGVVTENPTVAQGYSLPFYGKDRFGSYVQFVYQPNETWSTWSDNAISDGNNYKFRITQFYQETGEAVKVQLTSNLTAGTKYYIYYTGHYPYVYIYFTVANAEIFTSGNTIYFNYSHGIGWLLTSGGNARVITDISFGVANEQPDDATRINGATSVSAGDVFYNQFFTTQNAASAFITRAEPVLIVSPLTTTPVASATQNFTATYSQAQGDSINTVRWQLFNSTDMVTPIDDTGDVSTSVLSYEYNGLFDGQSYSVVCTVTTESGISISSSLAFDVQYTQNEYEGDFTARILCHEDANLLTWDSLTVIPGADTPSGSTQIVSGEAHIPIGSNVSWAQKKAAGSETMQPLGFSSPWTMLWKGQIAEKDAFLSKGTLETPWDTQITGDEYFRISRGTISPDGTWLVIQADVYSKTTFLKTRSNLYYYKTSSDSYSYIGQLGTLSAPNSYLDFSFSPDGTGLLVLHGNGTTTGDAYIVTPELISSSTQWLTNSANISADAIKFGAGGLFVIYKTMSGVAPNIWFYLYSDNAVQTRGTAQLTNSNNLLSVEFVSNFLIAGSFSGIQGAETDRVVSYNILLSSDNIRVSYNSAIPLGETYAPERIEYLQNMNLLLCTGGISTSTAFGEAELAMISVSQGQITIESQNTILSSDDSVLYGSFVGETGHILICGGTKAFLYDSVGGMLYDVASYMNGQYASTFIDGITSKGADLFLVTFYGMIISGASYEHENNLSIYEADGSYSTLISMGDSEIAVRGKSVALKVNSVTIDSILSGVAKICICLTESMLRVYQYIGQTANMIEKAVSYTQETIDTVQLYGEQYCDYFCVINDTPQSIIDDLLSSSFVPQWNNQDYETLMLATFDNGLSAGTGSDTSIGFRIYRRTASGAGYRELVTLPSSTTALRDYGIKSNESYIYDFYVYDSNGAFMGVRSTEATPLKRQFKRFSLLSTQYNESDKCYHVVKEYQFSCNIQDMTVSNNSNKSYVQNFTPYPTVFQSTANYASGTLQALIGFVDPKAYKYWDSTQLMDELNALSTTTNTLFLKDMKGHLWMVDVGTVQMTATQKTREMQVTISLPWTEIGDASDVSIIQTPDDEGWGIDAQVLDVKLNVDMETGLLYAVYPTPYSGTAFYLVGVTPEGVISAVQPLPSTASQPTDGQLKAVVRNK